MTIIDRRKTGAGKSADNRKKFLDRYRGKVRAQIDKKLGNKGITDTVKELGKQFKARINPRDISEPTFENDMSTGHNNHIMPGNDKHRIGDQFIIRRRGDGRGYDGEGEDDFEFALTKEELLEFYFGHLELPNFIKERLGKIFKIKTKTAGYSRDGIPARLSVKKTMEMAYARRIAAKAQGKKPRFLDDVDIRYRNQVKVKLPVRHAVVFMIMDVSGSMMEEHKTMAKKFFLLLYLFLTTKYENIELRFIRHYDQAEEVDEHTFFYDRKTGGTRVSSAFEVMRDIIQKDYAGGDTNIYCAQVSDGDNWPDDYDNLEQILVNDILPHIQYMVYVEELSRQRVGSLLDFYNRKICPKYDIVHTKEVNALSEIYEALVDLFGRGG